MLWVSGWVNTIPDGLSFGFVVGKWDLRGGGKGERGREGRERNGREYKSLDLFQSNIMKPLAIFCDFPHCRPPKSGRESPHTYDHTSVDGIQTRSRVSIKPNVDPSWIDRSSLQTAKQLGVSNLSLSNVSTAIGRNTPS